MSGRSNCPLAGAAGARKGRRGGIRSDWLASVASVAHAPTPAPAPAGTRASRSVAAGFAVGTRIPHSSLAGRSCGRKKNFGGPFSDDPRHLRNCLFLRRFPVPDALPVAPALPVPLLLALGRSPVSVLGLPPRPLPRSLPAAGAAIPLAHSLGAKALLASLQQATPPPRPAGRSFPPTDLLLLGTACRILGRAHGRYWLPEAPAPKKSGLFFGAQQTSGSL